MSTNIHHLRDGFGGRLVQRITSLPVIREVVGASVGGGVALALYSIFEFGRHLVGGRSIDVLAPVHASAAAVVAHGTVSLGLSATVALAGGCAFLHRRAMSDSSLRQA